MWLLIMEDNVREGREIKLLYIRCEKAAPNKEPLLFQQFNSSILCVYFFTVTFTLTVFPFAFTEMVAVPAFLPVITPLELTVATFLLEEV